MLTFLSVAVDGGVGVEEGLGGGLRNSPESGSSSSRSPQTSELPPGLSCRLTYPSASDDQGSEPEDTTQRSG